MKCPNCKAEMGEGKLLCENCGEEVMMVPDFDLELEQEINRTLRSMAEDFAEQIATDGEGEYEEPEESDDFVDLEDVMADSLKDYLPSWGVRMKPSTKRLAAIVLGVIVLIVVVWGGGTVISRLVRENSFDYQYQLGMDYYDNGQYSEALEYLGKAFELDAGHVQTRYQMALCYEQLGQIKSTILICHEILGLEGGQLTEVYDKLVSLYLESEAYAEVWNVLKGCEDEAILAKYNEYTAYAPQFDTTEGVYDEPVSVSFDNDADGFIYYTLDGTKPSKNSNVYQKPIRLQEGEYEIKAMFVNMYGVQSDVVTKSFYVKLAAPLAPEVNLDSDTYTEPAFIEVYHNNNTKIYYTKDGTTPTEKSIRYVDKMELPLGISNYAFVAVDENGLYSEVVKRTYRFEPDANFDADLALQVLLNTLLANGVLADLEGHVPDKEGMNLYTVQTAVEMDDVVYYIVHEEYMDEFGETADNMTMYAINCETAELFYAYKIKDGQYRLRSFAQ
ncbi:MAG: chitobiase/beta-hexosaminidase C-terminal domain-containing protein [Lachnospiraceae bacterium]|nr:chitobiase/beta-hexosaminidase C-terminal domain-containing protein [Lachnospiraceae bacterium]